MESSPTKTQPFYAPLPARNGSDADFAMAGPRESGNLADLCTRYTEQKRLAIEKSMGRKFTGGFDIPRFTVSDEETIKRLYGLK